MPSAKYANQNLININKDKVQEPFILIEQDDFWNAFNLINEVKGGSLGVLGLWMYLAQNSDGHELHFSPQDFMNLSSCSRSSTYKYRDKLIELGYLIPKDSNSFNFYMKPKKPIKKTFNINLLTFADAIRLDKNDMEELYYQLQETDVDYITEDMQKFYDFYQTELEE